MTAVAALLLALIGTDRLGDPLGPGVVARYGTTRLCGADIYFYDLLFHPTRDEVYVTKTKRQRFERREGSFAAIGWDCATGRRVYQSADEYDLRFDQTGRYRFGNELLGGLRVWDERRNRQIEVDSTQMMLTAGGFESRRTAIGFDGERLTTLSEVAGFNFGPQSQVVRVHHLGTNAVSKWHFVVDPSAPVATTRDGNTLWLADEKANEIRSHSADTGSVTSWRPMPAEPDTDPEPHHAISGDGRTVVRIEYRRDEKADRYRGFPECFIHMYDTAARRVQARYAFRLDAGDGDIPSSERGEPRRWSRFEPVCVSDDGRFAAWMDPYRRLRIRHLPTGRVVTAPGSGRLKFGPNGKRLAVLEPGGTIRLVDPFTGRSQHGEDVPVTISSEAAISPDGKRVATGHLCGDVWVWDAATGKPLWHTEADGESVRELHYNPTGTTVSAVGFWGPAGVRTFDARSGQELGPMLPYRYFRTVAVSADGKRIADLIEEKGVMEKGQWAYPLFVRTREVATGKELARVRLDHRLGLPNENNAVVSRDGRVMVVTHTDGDTFAYDTATGKQLAEFTRHPAGGNSAWAISDDGRIAVRLAPVATNANRVLVAFDLTTATPNTPIRSYPLGEEYHLGALSPDGRFVSLRSPRGGLLDLRCGGDPVRETSHPVDAFFPDGKSLLTLPGIRGAERVSLEPLAWTVAPPAKPTEARLKQLWTQLGEPAALDAVFELARHSAEAVPFLKSKLLTDPPDAKTVAAHVEGLGSKLFADREDASKALRAVGPEALPALRAALKAGPSPEVRSRIEKLLAVHADTAAPFTLARLRAVEVLERCGTPDARAVLKTLADTRAGTPWADDAARALVR